MSSLPSSAADLHPASGSPQELALWHSVVANESLLAAAAACDPADVAAVAQLRRKGSAPEIRVALALMLARRKAAAKLPAALAAQVMADPSAVEQASSWEAARWKAGRMREKRGDAPAALLDLCCGAGFDALAFADAGFAVDACDLDPVRAWMAERNLSLHGDHGARVVCADAASYADAPCFLHLDPARRDGTGRIFSLEAYLPPPEVWASLLRRAVGGCVKLAPGVAHAELAAFADTLGVPWSSSFVSERGRMVQALLWTGRFAGADAREAVLLAGGVAHVLSGGPGSAPMFHGEAGDPAFLCEADDAIERAQLLGVLAPMHGLAELHAGLGLLAGGQAVDPPRSPWLTSFQVLASFAWDEKKARVALRQHGAGLVEVKTRGQVCDPNALEKKLRGDGSERLTLFVLRLGTSLKGYVTRRCR